MKDWNKFTFIECNLCNIYFSESINFTKWWWILDQLIMHIQCNSCTNTKRFNSSSIIHFSNWYIEKLRWF